MADKRKNETVVVDKRFLARLLGKQGSRRRQALVAVGQDKWGIASMAIGGITAFLMGMDSFKKSEWLKKNWFVLPLLLVVAGFWLKRKGKSVGSTLIALGVFLAVQAYQNRPKDKDNASPNTSGPDEWNWAQPGSQWVMTPSGHYVLMPAHQAAAYSWSLPQATTAPVATQTSDPAAVLTRDIYQQRAA